MFTGDTLFAGGVHSFIAESGSLGDYINSVKSLETRRIRTTFPGHGEISDNPEDDLFRAIDNAMNLLKKEEDITVTLTYVM